LLKEIVMKNKMLTSTPHCLPEIDAQKKKIADRLTVLAGTMLERDELIAKYVALIAEKHKGRHREDPPKGGHQPNNKFISEAARELKMLGRNEGGRCALIARALRVAGICREAKDAAIQAGLAYKHKALLEIADAPLDQQVAKVQEIANRKRAPRSKKAGMGTVTPADSAKKATPDMQTLPPEQAGSIVPSQESSDADLDGDREKILSAWQGAAEIRQVLRTAPRADRQWFVKLLEDELCRD
jgi:hypothetical protein